MVQTGIEHKENKSVATTAAEQTNANNSAANNNNVSPELLSLLLQQQMAEQANAGAQPIVNGKSLEELAAVLSQVSQPGGNPAILPASGDSYLSSVAAGSVHVSTAVVQKLPHANTTGAVLVAHGRSLFLFGGKLRRVFGITFCDLVLNRKPHVRVS
jgi:hypothetical protein